MLPEKKQIFGVTTLNITPSFMNVNYETFVDISLTI